MPFPEAELGEKQQDIVLLKKLWPGKQELGGVQTYCFCKCDIFMVDLSSGQRKVSFHFLVEFQSHNIGAVSLTLVLTPGPLERYWEEGKRIA